MLYKFKSKVTGDVIMLEPNGRRVLEVIGKSPGDKGIIQSEEMAAAIAALQAAIVQEESQQKSPDALASNAAASKSDSESDQKPVSLRQRAMPFIDMLKRCEKEKAEVVWGV